jgi:hypothetical protein
LSRDLAFCLFWKWEFTSRRLGVFQGEVSGCRALR